MTIYEKLRKLGYNTPPDTFYSMVDVWDSWYKGKVQKFHSYRVYNGKKSVHCERYSAGMAKKVSEDWANLLMNEKVKITLEGKAEQEFFDEVCEDNNFAVRCNETQEKKAALGTAAYVCAIENAKVDEESGKVEPGGRIRIDYAVGNNIVPLSWENGIIKDCAFLTPKIVKGVKYIYCQIHQLDGDEYVIHNSIYRNDGGNMNEADLQDVEGFQRVAKTVHTGSKDPQFVIDRLNIANNISEDNPLGISVYANAIDQLKAVDIAYDSYVNEFVLGKKRIMVKPSAMVSIDGEPAFDANDVVFYIMPEDSKDDSVIHEIDMQLRTDAHKMGVQDMLNMLSAKCGFGENHYKFENGTISTATQIVSENSSMFRAVKKHEIILESALKQLARTILRLGNQYLGMKLNEDVEISIDFDDSIVEDKATEFQRDMTMLSAGIIQPYEFRMKWMNEDEATAKAALPQMQTLVETEVGADE